jgi:chemotaxis protein methyltransferase CheR
MAFTFFFRDMNALDIVQDHVMPFLKTRRHVDIWDAGCATGAEPYTLAILLRENMGAFMFRNVRIKATDLNPTFARTISEAEYPHESVKRIPPELLARYFAPSSTSDHYKLTDNIRKSVSFQHHDLTSLTPVGSAFSLIVCKNVLLHVTPKQRIDVLEMFHNSLDSGGYLTVEQTQKLPPEAEGWFQPVVPAGSVFRKCLQDRRQ